MNDILSSVLLSQKAVEQWIAFAGSESTLKKVKAAGYGSPGRIPDEEAAVNEDGSLDIFVPLKNGTRISLNIPASEWRWMDS